MFALAIKKGMLRMDAPCASQLSPYSYNINCKLTSDYRWPLARQRHLVSMKTASSAGTAMEINGGSTVILAFRGEPNPSRQTLIRWQKRIMAAPTGVADEPLGFQENATTNFIESVVRGLVERGDRRLLEGTIPVWCGNDATDMGNKLRLTKTGGFLNDADESSFDSRQPSPLVLQGEFQGHLALVDNVVAGGDVAGLALPLRFIAQHSPELIRQAVEAEDKEAKTLLKFARKNSGCTRKRLGAGARKKGKRELEAEAQRELGMQQGLSDMTVPLAAGEYDGAKAKACLTGKGGGRLVKVYASEYDEDDGAADSLGDACPELDEVLHLRNTATIDPAPLAAPLLCSAPALPCCISCLLRPLL